MKRKTIPGELSPFPVSTGPGNRGFAIVIVLAFIVLLTGVVLAVFLRATANRQISDSSAQAINLGILTRGALDQVVGDLKQEIAAGSTSTTINGATIYQPASALSAVPSRTSANAPANLVKWSSANTNFFDATTAVTYPEATTYTPSQRAANPALPTTDKSHNGRSINLARWNKPLLLPKADPSGTDVTPVTSGAGTFTAPDWILMSGNGSNPSALGPNVAGRYAYAIYDVGGVLDMNAAGYPVTAVTANAAEVGRKGALAFADLTKIPLGVSGHLPQADIDKIIAWRNAATATSGFDYVSAIRANTNGFLKVAGGNGTATDRAFVSRQALINFLTNGGNLTISRAEAQNALQYLGTFSRSVNAPSWAPDPSRPQILGAGASDARSATLTGGNMFAKMDLDVLNPSFTGTRVTRPFVRRDGSNAEAGDPLVKTRFPLRRLAWLTHRGPSAENMNDPVTRELIDVHGFSETELRAGTADAIHAAFGLRWDPAGLRWSYNHGLPQSIMTLSEVANAGREADFFELLQAAIHAGSLGASYVVSGTRVDRGPYRTAERFFGSPTPRDIPWVYPSQQVMEIGACIIDQFDIDSYPTEIFFQNRFDDGTPGNYASVFGQEALPGLHRIYAVTFRRSAPPAVPPWGAGDFGVYLLPEVWNVCDPDLSADPRWMPTQFRFRPDLPDPTYNLNFSVYGFWSFTPLQSPPLVWSSSNFDAAEPTLIHALPNITLTGSDGLPDLAGIPLVRLQAEVNGGNLSVSDTRFPSAKTNMTSTTPFIRGLHTPGVLGFGGYLDYLDADGDWRPYNRMLHASLNSAANSNPGSNITNPSPLLPANQKQIQSTSDLSSVDLLNIRFGSFIARPDPRSDRFPPSRFDTSVTDAVQPVGGQLPTTRPGAGIGGYGRLGDFRLPVNWTVLPLPTGLEQYLGLMGINQDTGARFSSSSFYRDPDGVVRGADGAYEVASKWDGRMLATGANVPGGRNFSRPLILNRPFRSVGELGYAFRAAPWKSIDFFSDNSGDSALLDVFSLSETPVAGIVAGVISPNTRNAAVIEALLSGAIKDETRLTGTSGPMPVALTPTQSQLLADSVLNASKALPFVNRADIVGRLVGNPALFPLQPAGSAAPDDAAIVKRRREAAVRALADVSEIRTWNLMIDLIAQVGRSTQTSPPSFIVEGEQRLWVHLAVDRYSGEVVEMVAEVVNE
jgi:hypothetical protein